MINQSNAEVEVGGAEEKRVRTQVTRARFWVNREEWQGTRLFRVIIHQHFNMATFGWDRGQIYSTSVLPGEDKVNSHAELTAMFQEFIQNFRIDNSFVYRQVPHPFTWISHAIGY